MTRPPAWVSPWLASALLACNGGKDFTTPGIDTDPVDDTGSDTDPITEPTLPPVTWSAGPALPACTPASGSGSAVALSGVVLTSSGPVAGVVVYDRSSGEITCAGASCDTADATVVCTGGVIGPALIDAHDHTQYNVLAPWQHGELYQNRYEWQSDGDYYDYREAYDAMADDYACEIVKWAELREIVGGSTSVVGSTGGDCVDGIARNLDETAASGLSGWSLEYSSGRPEYLDATDGADRRADLASGATDVFLDHVAEGVFGTVRDEIDHMVSIGAEGPGNVYVHATDASVEQLARMATKGTGIVWSPRSNLDLYADTTLADVGLAMGVPVVLGPDWTWSGSNRVTQELSCTWDWLRSRNARTTDQDLFDMVTVDSSVLLGLQGRLGVLDAGARADLSVFAWSGEPYRAVIESDYEDVRLVIVDGVARYGVPELVAGLEADPARCETVTACTEERTLCVAEADTGTDALGYADLEDALSGALAATAMPSALAYAGELYPLWACDEVRDPCDLSSPSAADADGDGVVDGADLCPVGYDPFQTDHDGDGRGDACDLCPLTAETTCAHDPGDIDDDGLANEDDACPYLADPGNPDTDGNGQADACDHSVTIRAVRDPSDPAHPAEGTLVTVADLVVIGAGSSGFFAQDPTASEYGGLYVFGGDAAVGQLVTVTGVYDESYGLTQLANATVVVQGPGALPAPLEVSACDIGTGGPDAERYESMLVEVAGVSVSDANPDDPDDYNEFEVEGCLRVDDKLCPACWTDQPAVGTAYGALTGPLDYSFSNTKILPREAADLR